MKEQLEKLLIEFGSELNKVEEEYDNNEFVKKYWEYRRNSSDVDSKIIHWEALWKLYIKNALPEPILPTFEEFYNIENQDLNIKSNNLHTGILATYDLIKSKFSIMDYGIGNPKVKLINKYKTETQEQFIEFDTKVAQYEFYCKDIIDEDQKLNRYAKYHQHISKIKEEYSKEMEDKLYKEWIIKNPKPIHTIEDPHTIKSMRLDLEIARKIKDDKINVIKSKYKKLFKELLSK